MSRVLLIGGSPSRSSRGAALLGRIERRAAGRGHTVQTLEVRDLPPAELTAAARDSQALNDAAALVAAADGVVIASPVYKAAYTGLLKCFLDILPTDTALRGKVAFPIVTAAAPTHVLALDFALKPVLGALGASKILAGFWTLDSQYETGPGGVMALNAETGARFDAAIDAFLDELPAT